MSTDPFDTLRTFVTESGASGNYFSLPALEKMAPGKVSRLPVSLRIVPRACCATATARR